MNLNDLLKEGKIKKINIDLVQAEECISAAKRDIKVAKKMLSEDFDWAFSVAYNSMQLSVRALMFADGFAPATENKHKITIEYADVKLGVKLRETIDLFDSMRKKRHLAVYEKVGAISEFEAKNAIKTAEEFLKKVEEKIEK